MRNGTGQDRGNAVLTTETLIDPRAIESPVRHAAARRGRLELFFGGWVGRLDHIFTNLAEDHWTTRCSTIPHFFGSDHRPIVLVPTRGQQAGIRRGAGSRRQP